MLLVAAIGLTIVLLVGLLRPLDRRARAIGERHREADLRGRAPGWRSSSSFQRTVGAFFNGVLIARLGLLLSFVVTLGTASLFGGARCRSATVSRRTCIDLPPRSIGSGTVAGVPWPVVIAVTVLSLALIVTRYTGYGRTPDAVGGNQEAARLSGITPPHRMSAYSDLRRARRAGRRDEAGRLPAFSLHRTHRRASRSPRRRPCSSAATSFVGGSGGRFVLSLSRRTVPRRRLQWADHLGHVRRLAGGPHRGTAPIVAVDHRLRAGDSAQVIRIPDESKRVGLHRVRRQRKLGRLRGPTWLSPADLEPVSGIDGSQPRRHRGSLPDDRSREWPRSAEDEGPVLHALLRGR